LGAGTGLGAILGGTGAGVGMGFGAILGGTGAGVGMGFGAILGGGGGSNFAIGFVPTFDNGTCCPPEFGNDPKLMAYFLYLLGNLLPLAVGLVLGPVLLCKPSRAGFVVPA